MKVPKSDNGQRGPWGNDMPTSMPMEISAQIAERIEEALAVLVDDVELDFAAVLDDSGAVLGWAAAAEVAANEDDSTAGANLAMVEGMVDSSGALAMGAFAAAQTLAAQLGGEASREMIHHAGSRSFHLTEVTRGVALFSVWSGALALGFLRERAARAVQDLQAEIANLRVASPAQRMTDEIPSQSPLIDFPVARNTASSGLERRFAKASGNGIACGDGDRYVFEIG